MDRITSGSAGARHDRRGSKQEILAQIVPGLVVLCHGVDREEAAVIVSVPEVLDLVKAQRPSVGRPRGSWQPSRRP